MSWTSVTTVPASTGPNGSASQCATLSGGSAGFGRGGTAGRPCGGRRRARTLGNLGVVVHSASGQGEISAVYQQQALDRFGQLGDRLGEANTALALALATEIDKSEEQARAALARLGAAATA